MKQIPRLLSREMVFAKEVADRAVVFDLEILLKQASPRRYL